MKKVTKTEKKQRDPLPTNDNQKIDQKSLDKRVDAAKTVLKNNTAELKKMESKRDLHGFNLGGLTATDLYNNAK